MDIKAVPVQAADWQMHNSGTSAQLLFSQISLSFDVCVSRILCNLLYAGSFPNIPIYIYIYLYIDVKIDRFLFSCFWHKPKHLYIYIKRFRTRCNPQQPGHMWHGAFVCTMPYAHVRHDVFTCDVTRPWSTWPNHSGWRGLMGCLTLQVLFRKRATNYMALLRKMTYEDKVFYDSTPPYVTNSKYSYDTVPREGEAEGWAIYSDSLYSNI